MEQFIKRLQNCLISFIGIKSYFLWFVLIELSFSKILDKTRQKQALKEDKEFDAAS